MGNGSGGAEQALFEKLREHSQRIEVDGVDFWRVEGDILLDEVRLGEYARQRTAILEKASAAASDHRLVAEVDHATHKIVRWAPGLQLSYCVLKKTFQSEKAYDLVVDRMRKATADWEATCGVKFAHLAELDTSDSLMPDGVLFVVREFDAQGKFLASAFFPRDPADRRRVLIDPSFYPRHPKLRFDKAGILRHELGHVLGFRPEAPMGCPDEATFGTINLGDYDPKSAMHYFCGGVGTEELEITALDKAGAQQVYGPPLSDFTLVDAG